MGNNSWALADKYSVYIHDLLPQSTRNWHCPRYLRTGRSVDWNLVYVKVFGAPLVYCPMGGPIHKRAALNAEGHFAGIQWPAALIKRKEDGKILSCARQKMRVYESAYLAPMNQRVDHEENVKHILGPGGPPGRPGVPGSMGSLRRTQWTPRTPKTLEVILGRPRGPQEPLDTHGL